MKGPKTNIILCFLCLALVSCSQNKRVSVLSFFFDGVPESSENSEITPGDSLLFDQAGTDTLSIASAGPSMFYHEPYQKKQCMACHDKNAVSELINEEPQLCYSCHENFNKKYEKLHGPVDFGFCIVCHEPHMSENEHLQIKAGNALCFPCHVSYEVKQPDTHIEIGDELCSKCHNPHGENPIEAVDEQGP